MAYIGAQPRLGNFQACDAITTSSTATFNLLVGGTAIFPQSAQHCLVSLNGVLQAPISSYTISGSTIVFASSLTSADSIDFITILGDTLDLGVPSDDTVGAAQIKADLISGTTALTSQPASTDELLLSDAGTIKRIDAQLIQNTPMFDAYAPTDQVITDNTNTKITFSTERFDSDGTYDHSTNYRFTPGIAGKYYIYAYVRAGHSNDGSLGNNTISIYKNGSDYYTLANDHQDNQPKSETQAISAVIDSDDNDYFEIYAKYNMASVNATVYNGHFGAFKVTGA
jgi:hypothetical protein